MLINSKVPTKAFIKETPFVEENSRRTRIWAAVALATYTIFVPSASAQTPNSNRANPEALATHEDKNSSVFRPEKMMVQVARSEDYRPAL